MMFNKTFIKTICITLMATLLAFNAGRVTCVYGMAAPTLAPAINPIYDTEIIELKNYVDILSPGSREVFFTLAGLAVAAQGGSQNAKLVNPYSQPSDVYEWLSGCGVNLYNNVVGYTGTYNTQLGIDVGPILKILVAQLMGDAVFAAQYQSVNDFVTDTDSIYLPINKDIQQGVNFLFACDQGLYNWQLTEGEFSTTGFDWSHVDLTGTLRSEYNTLLAQLSTPRHFVSDIIYMANHVSPLNSYNNAIVDCDARFDFFINNVDHTVELIHTSGNRNCKFLGVYYGDATLINSYASTEAGGLSYNPNDFNSYQDIVNYFISRYGSSYGLLYFYDNHGRVYVPRYSDFIDNYLVGSSHSTAVPVSNTTDLNFDFDNVQYYEQLQGEYLLDIRNLLDDLLNQTDLHVPVYNNIYDPYGNQILDPLYHLVNVALNIQQYLDELNPPLPVDLNEISELTDNSYLARVKEHARNFGDIFVNYIFFWHNCDADIVYTLFGASIMVLIGAFIGKWGHS